MNNPTISMSVWRRPDYTKEVLDALSRCSRASEHDLVVAVDCEGDDPNPDVMQVVLSQTWPKDLRVTVMRGHSGCNATVRAAIGMAFEKSNYVIHIEDDVKVSGDALDWFRWAGEKYKDDSSVFTVASWRHPCGWLPEMKRDKLPDEHGMAARESFFTCWGWATWKDRWVAMKDGWSTKGDHELSWDVRMSEMRGDRVQIAPLISRSLNIGAMKGTHRGHCPLSYWQGNNGTGHSAIFREVQVDLLPGMASR